MPTAKLTVEVPEGAWMHALSTANPETTFTVVSVLPGTDTSVALVEFRSDDLLSLLSAVRDRPDVVQLELIWTRGDDVRVEVETTTPQLLEPLLRAGVPLKTPFDVRTGEASWELTTAADRLSALGDQLAERGVDFELHEVVSDDVEDGRVTTDRQREFLRTAVDNGYYQVPREITLTDLADEMGVGKASASDTLARAERRVVEWFADRKLGVEAPPTG